MRILYDAFRVYWFALCLALRCIMAGQVLNGFKLLIAPVGYWRFLPFAYVLEEMKHLDRPAVLDVSSPKVLSIYLAQKMAAQVTAVDLDDVRIFSRWAQAAEATGVKNYTVEYQDARRLTYPDESFDLVYSISVIEHIPEDGDSVALAEFARVLRPAGTAIVEVPYRREHKDIYLRWDSKGVPLSTRRFFERRYDAQSLQDRLTLDGFEVSKKLILGETVPIDPWIATDRLPRVVRMLFLPFEPVLAALNYWARATDDRGRPLAALIVYKKGPSAVN